MTPGDKWNITRHPPLIGISVSDSLTAAYVNLLLLLFLAKVACVKSRDMHWALVAHRDQRDINLSSLRMLIVADGANPCKWRVCCQLETGRLWRSILCALSFPSLIFISANELAQNNITHPSLLEWRDGSEQSFYRCTALGWGISWFYRGSYIFNPSFLVCKMVPEMESFMGWNEVIARYDQEISAILWSMYSFVDQQVNVSLSNHVIKRE